VWIHDEPGSVRHDLLHVLQAVSEIETATSEISRTLPLPGPLRIGAGVNTGPAIIGGADYTAFGDTVNAAFRLEAATKTIGLDIVMGERTFSELRLSLPAPFVHRQVELKGYDSPAIAWATSFDQLREFIRGRGNASRQ